MPLGAANTVNLGFTSYGGLNIGLVSDLTKRLPETQSLINNLNAAANLQLNLKGSQKSVYPCTFALSNLIVNTLVAETVHLQAKIERSMVS